MKRLIVFLLIFSLLSGSAGLLPVAEADRSMAYTEEQLETDNSFNPAVDTTIGRGNAGNNSYIAQSFVANGEPVTGCRLHFRLGDTATMTVQIRTALTGGDETILYSGNFPLVSNPHNITGWWSFEFSRAVALTAGKTYYLVAWCDIYHSYCIMSTTRYLCGNIVNPSYRRAENSDEWKTLSRRSYGYELFTDPTAQVIGYPYQADDNTLMLHNAEEAYCFTRSAANTRLSLTNQYSSQGYYSMQVTGGAPDEAGAVFTAYVDFDSQAAWQEYRYYYADVFLSQAIDTAFRLRLTYTDSNGNGAYYETPLQGRAKGWHRLIFTPDDMTALGNGSLARLTTLTLTGYADRMPADLTVCFDNLRVSKTEVKTVSSGYYTEEELVRPNEEASDPNAPYIGNKNNAVPVTLGDPNNDTAVNSSDALFVLQCSVKKAVPGGTQYKAGDVDGNNRLDAVDALWILRYAVKKVSHFPAVEEEEPVSGADFRITADGLQPNTVYRITTATILQTPDGILPHDFARLVSSLQGLINREIATNRVALVIVDQYTGTWLSYLQENDTLLEGMDNRVNITGLEQFLSVFKNQLLQCGMVLWDPAVPATANVAETVCGLDGYLPVKYLEGKNTLYQKLVELGVPVELSLADKFTGEGLIPGTCILSTGSIKCDPYLWALEKYASRCSDRYLIYTPDGASSTEGNIIYEEDVHSQSLDYNHSYGYDYGIYRKAFFFDLTADGSEAPCDDPNQIIGTDVATLKEILLNRYYRAGGAFAEIIGFPPWPLKYTSHNGWNTIEATTLEATFTALVTQYNCYMDADGSIANCSLYAQFTMEDSYRSLANAKPVTEVFVENTMYLYMYTGDYDSAAWALEHLYAAYNDSARGTLPITWSITPGLSDRIPMLFDYLYKNQTDMDFFSASDSGIGYVRPQSLFRSESERTLPDGDREFIQISKQYFDRFDMDSVGFIIGTLSDKVCKTYNQFAPVGSNTNDSAWSPSVYAGTPYVRIKNGIGNPAATEEAMETAVSGMYEFADSMRNYHAAGFRTIKFKAGDLKRTQEAFIAYASEKDPDTTYKFVDYKTYFAMLAASGNGRYTLD